MIKRFFFTLFIILLLIIFIAVLYGNLSDIQFYSSTLILMFLGLFLYPLNKKFEKKSDFLIIPFLITIVFNLGNIFIVKNFGENLSLINLIFGIFGFGQYFYSSMNKKHCTTKYKQNKG
jgi:hypothetical protein